MELPPSAPYYKKRPKEIGMTESSPNRKRIIEALLTLLADQPIERIGLGDIAAAAGVSLAELREEFSSVFSILAAHMKEIDRQVLAADFSDMSEEPVRERLFDILMKRLEAHAPHKAAIRSLMRSSLRNPPLALALNSFAARSMSWMMTAAGISTAGPRGVVRAQALTLLYARVVATWAEDDDPGLAKTMAVLDRELARGQQLSGLLDTLLAIPGRLQSGRWRARRHRDQKSDDDIIAA
jgi:AcrR family transcriptional regulator